MTEKEINTRPAAPVEGLKTIARLGGLNGVCLQRHIENFRPEAQTEYKDELVKRSQAEAIIAAEEAETRRWMDKYNMLEADNIKLKADNAALTARVKELEDERVMIVSHATMGGTDGADMSVNDISIRVTALRNELYHEGKNRAEALETQLTVARKALEEIASHPEEGRINNRPYAVTWAFYNVREIARAALEDKP